MCQIVLWCNLKRWLSEQWTNRDKINLPDNLIPVHQPFGISTVNLTFHWNTKLGWDIHVVYTQFYTFYEKEKWNFKFHNTCGDISVSEIYIIGSIDLSNLNNWDQNCRICRCISFSKKNVTSSEKIDLTHIDYKNYRKLVI